MARALWRRHEASLAAAAAAGVVEAFVSSWLLAIAMRDLLLVVHGDVATPMPLAIAGLARIGLVIAEALGAFAVSVVAGWLLVRMEARPAARETIPFWTRVVAVVRLVGGAIVFGAAWKLGWSVVLESRAPWLLLVLAGVQLAALVVGSFRPISSRRSLPPSTPARASGKQSP